MTYNMVCDRIKEQTKRSLTSRPLLADRHRQTSNHFYKIEEIEKLFYEHLISKNPREKYNFMELGAQCGLHAQHFINVFKDNINKFIINDISKEAVEKAKVRLGDFSEIIEFIISPAEEIILDCKCDGIYLNASLHHFEDPFKAIKVVKKLLRPGGLFVLCEPVVWCPPNLYRAITLKDERRQLTLARKGNIKKYLKSAGFNLISERVLHLRLGSWIFEKYNLHKKIEKIKLLNPAAIVFLLGAIVPSEN